MTQKIENGACVDCAAGEIQGKVLIRSSTFNIHVEKWIISNSIKTVPIPVNVLHAQSTKYQMQPVDALIVQPWKLSKIMPVQHVLSISMLKLVQMALESAMTVMLIKLYRTMFVTIVPMDRFVTKIQDRMK